MAHGPVYLLVYNHNWSRSNDFYVRDAAEDRVEAFHEGLTFLKELDIPFEHSEWSATKWPMAYPTPCLEPYSSILLLGFDEEEYLSRPTKIEDNVQESATEVKMEQEKKAE